MDRKPVKQENAEGCAVACLAFVLNIPYPQTLIKLGISKERARKNHDFYGKEILSWLFREGLIYNYKYLKPKFKTKLKQELTIVYIKRSERYKFGHYLVRWQDTWMDPWINLPNYPRRAGFRKRLPGKPAFVIFKA